MVKRLSNTNQNNTTLINIPTPSSSGDAASKGYVDDGLGLKQDAAPITKESIGQPTTYVAFGDSITDGYNATSVPNEYPSIIAATKGWSLTNLGSSGKRMNDPAMIDNMYAEVVDNTKVYTLLSGVNDAAVSGTDITLLDSFRGCLQAGIAWLAIPDVFKIKAASATRTGTWAVNGSVYGGMDYRSYTNGSTISATVHGTTAYLGYIRALGATGTFTVSVDGTSRGTFSTSVDTPTRQGGDNGEYGAYLLRFPGLAPGKHTITVTVTSATNTQNSVYIDWFGGNGFLNDPNGPAVYVGNCMRASDAFWAAHPSQVGEAAVAAYNLAINEAITSLSNDGLNVCLVDVVNQEDRAADLSSDGLHPNDTGHAHLAQMFLDEMSSFSKPNDKGVVNSKSTPWTLATLQNSWVSFGSSFYPPAYMKDSTGRVWLRGLVKNGTIGTNAIFTLPQGFRPAMDIHMIVASNSSTGAIGVVEIRNSGIVRATVGSNVYVSFDNLSFMAEQ